MSEFLTTPEGRRIAYDRIGGRTPGVVFLGGFKSDKEGTKALALEAWAKAAGRAFLRLDYSGHGQSSGEFLDGAIGDWFEDARAAITALTEGPQVLVGSSMGGWIALLMAREMPEKVAGLVTIAAAPDFTEDGMWGAFSEDQRRELMEAGRVALPSDYSDEPYIITRRLIEEGRGRLVLRRPLDLPFPVRMLQGTEDADVPLAVAVRLIEHVMGPDIRLIVVKGADHRFSTPDCLKLIELSVVKVLARLEGGAG
ncbi:alpha/beta hydrolase [Defluviimonas sp. WL0024]|uniref:Palmitoyl-protein thioesterase ABHD10, mitochondrial n=2 Tax=Albidovulum TaxID=205889 RepID=A0ABT3J2L3_9RHOB|nr:MULTISPECIES: alpha/beta hydrolase [Defluviimonas]MCU9847640.1 alpha/beta hydrolase [Defluviimonas sp. WL0024]MCW3781932.1 alpha/beta hydrolase [Defluviimonas salinarum]